MPVAYQIHAPNPLLKPFVRYYLSLRMGDLRGAQQFLLPAKTEEGIFINTGNESVITREGKGGGDISGNPFCCKIRGAVAEASLRIHLQIELEMFVIAFHPGGLHKFFGLPATEIANAYTPAQWLLGAEWEEMGIRIRESRNFKERVNLAENQLLRHYPKSELRPGCVDSVVTRIIKGSLFRVEEMARSACLSERQFRRRFMEEVGISPSRFASICRLQQVVQARHKNPLQSWRSLAFEWGYTDQSHLLKDMKSLLGMAGAPDVQPEQYLHVEGSSYRVLQEATLEGAVKTR